MGVTSVVPFFAAGCCGAGPTKRPAGIIVKWWKIGKNHSNITTNHSNAKIPCGIDKSAHVENKRHPADKDGGCECFSLAPPSFFYHAWCPFLIPEADICVFFISSLSLYLYLSLLLCLFLLQSFYFASWCLMHDNWCRKHAGRSNVPANSGEWEKRWGGMEKLFGTISIFTPLWHFPPPLYAWRGKASSAMMPFSMWLQLLFVVLLVWFVSYRDRSMAGVTTASNTVFACICCLFTVLIRFSTNRVYVGKRRKLIFIYGMVR